MIYGHSQQNDVAEFHRALDIPIGDSPGLRRVELRCALLAEECKEAVEAAQVGDLVAAADGLCDLIYVAYGAALEWGLDLAPLWDAVQAANMAKVGGPTRPDGKKLKPEGWEPPNISGLVAQQIAQSKPAGVYGSIIGRSGTAALGR